ncbi:MAG: N-acetylmuramic acid 6-phosphate etherase [Planctomycetaceae bacterium]|nr:N-acetylmuramic acid 6-phosphate etherase [Planctomycetaceae bacterium]
MNLDHLTTESQNPNSQELDRLSSLEIVQLMNAEDGRIAKAVAKIAEAIAQAIDVITDRLTVGGRLIYIGAGTSGRLGVLDASECPPTFNSPPWQVIGLIAGGNTALTRAVEGAEDHPEFAVADLKRLDFNSSDVLVGIATSGRTPYVLGGLEYARSVGAYSISLTCNADTAMSKISNLTLAPILGPEIISGSTRLKAGTATKFVLNMLSTGAMVKRGKVYGNLMVDLQATNEKLSDRSGRIVTALTGLSRDQASTLLKKCDGDVKTSIVAHQRGISPDAARRFLEKSFGNLREALSRDAISSLSEPAVDDRNLILGVDGGGSKTLAWLIDTASESQVPVGVGESGPSNPLSVGWHTATANIDLAIDRAFKNARISRRQVAAACLAIAGTGRDLERQRLGQWAEQRRIAERILVTHDAHPVLIAGTSAFIRIALIAGTGSIAYGTSPQGEQARAGGWGQVFGDDGSGYSMARSALHAISRAFDRTGPATRLTDYVLQALNCSTVIDLREAVSHEAMDAKRLAQLAPLVISAAEKSDQVANDLVEEAANGLSDLVLAVHNQLQKGQETDFVDLALSGGILIHADRLRQRILDHIAEAGVVVTNVTVVDNPIRGTLQLARDMLGTCIAAPDSK